jgi:hypothetical protein
MRFVLAGLLATSLAACSDGNPIAPPSGPDQPPATLAEAPLQDALERIVPSLGGSTAAAALRSALTAAVNGQGADAVPAIESALAQLEAEQPDAAVEADVIRLAISARP